MSLFAWITSLTHRRRRRALFDEALGTHGDSIRRAVSAYAPPGAAREDLEQEVMLALWEALARFEARSSLRTYVLRVTHNRCVDALRRREPQWRELDARLAASEPDAHRITDAREQLARARRALRALPLPQRQALTLALEGMPHAEIAQTVGASEGAVAVRIHRARNTLRATLDHPENP